MIQQMMLTINYPNLICIFILMLSSFLLGWLLKKPREKILEMRINEGKQTNEQSLDDLKLQDISSGIRATKTMDRQGKAVDKPQLNFNSFGKANESERDDLKKINGIGPFIEEKLNSIGIYTYEQVSKFSEEDIETVTELIAFFPGRISRDAWKTQAQNILSSKNNNESKAD